MPQTLAGARAAPDCSLAQSIAIYVAQHSHADVRRFFAAALGYEAFGDTDVVSDDGGTAVIHVMRARRTFLEGWPTK